jgi:hypothetical protein
MDAFQLLGLPRRAALDEAAVKAAYDARVGGAEGPAAGALNTAYETLSAPHLRLRHLKELLAEGGAGPAWAPVRMEPEWMTLFETLGGLLQQGADLVRQRDAAASALAKALLAPRTLALAGELEQLQQRLESLETGCLEGLAQLDEAMEAKDVGALARLSDAQARLAYLAKWRAQAREMLWRLA